MASTPNMALEIGVPGSTPGPDWAELIERNKEAIDEHDHSPTKGVPVPSAGLNHNDEEDFGDNGILNARVVQLAERTSPPSDLAVIYRDSSGDLYWKNAGGVSVQLTSGSALAASVLGNGFWQTEEKSAGFTLSGSNKTLLRINTTAAARAVTLPPVSSITQGQYWVVVVTGSNGATFAPDGTDTLNGAATAYTLRADQGAALLTCTDDGWTLSSMFNGTVNDATITAGNYLRRKAGTPQEYEFTAVDLTDDTNGVSGRLKPGNMSQATTGAEGIVQLARDLGGTSTAPTVLALTGNAGLFTIRSTAATLQWEAGTTSPTIKQAGATASAGQTLTIEGQAGDGTGNNGGSVVIQGGSYGASATSGAVQLVSTDTSLHVAALGSSRRKVIGLLIEPTEVRVPDGNGVLFLGSADTKPTTVPTDGIALFADGAYLAAKGSGIRSYTGSTAIGAVGSLTLLNSDSSDYNVFNSSSLWFSKANSGVTIKAQSTSAGAGGSLTLSGQATSAAVSSGGALLLYGGSATSGLGGDVTVAGGASSGSVGGHVHIGAGNDDAMIHVYSPGSGKSRLVIATGADDDASSVNGGDTAGDGCIYVGNATSLPNGTMYSGGFVMYGASGHPTFMTVEGDIGLVGGLLTPPSGGLDRYTTDSNVGTFPYIRVVIGGTIYRIPVWEDS